MCVDEEGRSRKLDFKRRWCDDGAAARHDSFPGLQLVAENRACLAKPRDVTASATGHMTTYTLGASPSDHCEILVWL